MNPQLKEYRVLVVPSPLAGPGALLARMSRFSLLPRAALSAWNGCVMARAASPLEFADAAARLPGVESVSVGRPTAPDMESLSKACRDAALKVVPARKRYSVRVRRLAGDADEADLEMALASRLIDVMAPRGSKVDSRHPDRLIEVVVAEGSAFVSYIRKDGPGGRDFGASGRGVSLFDGGAGSVLATLQMARAGFDPALLMAYDDSMRSAALRRAVESGCYVREGFPRDDCALLLADSSGMTGSMEGLSGRTRDLAFHMYLASLASRVGRDEGASAVFTGIAQGAHLLAAYHRLCSLPVQHPLLGGEAGAPAGRLPAFLRRAAEPREAEEEKGELPSDKEVRRAASGSAVVPIPLSRHSSFHGSIDLAVSALRRLAATS
ncbi:MAG: hypothetical protein JRN39_03450 [Nitrososphaerota archaeon]|nr:hypothetical protein [Nitrososphaerota archaeon]MDG6939439.1 hypothetical protein [Nitrososphaerota archaeon]